MEIIQLILLISAFVVAITIHEAAHAYVADRLGDPTPRLDGRLSLNPIVHYDPIGTTLLLVLVVLRAFHIPVIPFGWAKPVRFDPYNLAHPKRDAGLISLAGPAANISLATLLGIVLKINSSPFTPIPILEFLLAPFILLNVALAVFNLIPIHPLDGGKILVALLPFRQARQVDAFLNQYGILILFLLIFPSFGGGSFISWVISPLIKFFLNIFLPGNPVV